MQLPCKYIESNVNKSHYDEVKATVIVSCAVIAVILSFTVIVNVSYVCNLFGLWLAVLGMGCDGWPVKQCTCRLVFFLCVCFSASALICMLLEC